MKDDQTYSAALQTMKWLSQMNHCTLIMTG